MCAAIGAHLNSTSHYAGKKHGSKGEGITGESDMNSWCLCMGVCRCACFYVTCI